MDLPWGSKRTIPCIGLIHALFLCIAFALICHFVYSPPDYVQVGFHVAVFVWWIVAQFTGC